jgi:hypothetical protein
MPPYHPGLKRIYNRFNRLYFGGKLPDISIVWEPCGDSNGVTHMWDGKAKRLCIDPCMRGCTRYVKIIILHEMIHVKFPRTHHGKVFKAERQRLWDEGAFDRLI